MKIMLFLTMICLLAVLSTCHKKIVSDKDKERLKPNIIYIVADDMGYGDLSCYGQKKFTTPNIDRLASEGIRFTQHYAGAAVCSPSRSVLMTGLHSGHTYVRDNRGMHEGQYPLPKDALTVAEIAQQAGYVTGAFGKWGLGYPDSEGDPVNQGFDEFFGYKSQTYAHNYYPWHLWHNREKVFLSANEGEMRGTYAPALIHEKVLEFMEINKDSSFFLFVPSIIPHKELFAPKEYIDKFMIKSPADTSRMVSKFAPEKPFNGVDDAGDPRFKKGAYGSQPYPNAAYAAMITALDDQVGDIIDKVKELGIEDRTIIIFTSDNGPTGSPSHYFDSNGSLRGHKQELYEGGIRVPLIARWPGKIKAGTSSDHISSFQDFMPTFCELAGVSIPDKIDGRSFLPTLLGEGNQPKHKHLYWEAHAENKKQAVRKNEWKAVRTGLGENPDASVELYNLTTDPGEEHDVAIDNPGIAAEMLLIMKEEHVENPDWPFFQTNNNKTVKK